MNKIPLFFPIRWGMIKCRKLYSDTTIFYGGKFNEKDFIRNI